MISLSRAISAQAERQHAAAAVICGEETLSWAELEQDSNRIARRHMQDVGIDDFVAVVLGNGIDFIKSVVAAWKLGAVPLPVSPKLTTPERRAILKLVNPRLVIDAKPAVEEKLPANSIEDRQARSWKAILSGGSTGLPKVIVDRRPARLGSHVLNDSMHAGDRVLIPGPLYHNAGFKHAANALFCGACVILMPRFEPRQFLELMQQHRVQWASVVPTMMLRVWRLPEREQYDLSGLRLLTHAAAPCPPWLKRAYIDWLGADRIHEVYGGAENSGMTSISGAEWLAHPGSVGRPMAGHAFKVFDAVGNELPRGEVGEIFTLPPDGPGSTYYYLGAAPRCRPDGWESIGDMGRIDAEGYVYLADRRTDMILRGGANIYPAEIEAAIDAHPGVRSSAVIGLPDDDLGNRVHAIVEAASVPEADLAAFLAARLARNKLPASYEFVDYPLRDDAGKIRRGALRESRMKPAAAMPQPIFATHPGEPS